MSAINILQPFNVFGDVDGDPLEDGFIYIGAAGFDPIANPVAVYFDEAQTIPAAQPIRTSGGRPLNAGTFASLYVAPGDYSILIRNKHNTTVSLRLSGNVVLTPAGTVETTTALIAGRFPAVGAGAIINTLGYTTGGDGGGAQWRKTGVTGLTASQSPLQTGALTLNDAAGDQWAPVVDTTLSVKALGAKGDGVQDDTVYLQALLSAGVAMFVPTGTYAVTGLTLLNGSVVQGPPSARPTIKLSDGANAHVLFGIDTSDVSLSDIIVDGNKANQSIGAGNNWRGVYFAGECHRLRADNVEVRDTVDHGFFMSDGGVLADECGKDSLLTNVRVTGSGSEAHLAAGGAGGSGVVGGTVSTTYAGCFATGNHLNGFKGNGSYMGCDSYANGGGWETGFSSPETVQIKWVNCRAFSNTGDGWRNQGQGDQLTWEGCEARDNGLCGIIFLNNVNRATVSGCWFVNNGQRRAEAARSGTNGYDGIYITGTSGAPRDITITGSQFFDDQVTKTQETGVYVNIVATGVHIDDSNMFGDAFTQPFYISSAGYGSDLFAGAARGIGFTDRDYVPVTVTGTTMETDLQTITVPARAMNDSVRLAVSAVGSVSGTNDAKTIRLQVDATAVIISAQAAGDEQRWSMEAVVERSGSLVFVRYSCTEIGGTTTENVVSLSHSASNPLTIKLTATLANGADSVTQDKWTVASI